MVVSNKTSYRVTPAFLLRIGGLPVELVDGLQFRETVKLTTTLLTLEQTMMARKETLGDALYQTIGLAKEDPMLRRQLLHMRRAVFNMRAPEQPEEFAVLACTLLSPIRELLLEWVELWRMHANVVARCEDVFAHELQEKRTLLKEIATLRSFRQGIALSSPLLDTALEGYVLSQQSHLTHAMRTAERSLLEYLFRTAFKTSPFSTFTSVSAGRFTQENAASALVYDPTDWERKSFTRLNIALLSRLSSLIVASPTMRGELPVSLVPGWQIEKKRVRYLRRLQNEHENAKASQLELLHESVFYLPLGELLVCILDILQERPALRFHQLVEQLTSIPAYRDAEDEIHAYLDHLLRLGLLTVPELQVDINQKHPLQSYRKALQRLHIAGTTPVIVQLEKIESLVEAYASASARERGILLGTIKSAMQACYVETGHEEQLLPGTIIYEDTTTHISQLSINETAWRPLVSDVAEFQEILPIFDLNLPKTIVTQGYFQARYGAGKRCDDFLTFANEFRQRFYVHYLENTRQLSSDTTQDTSEHALNFFKQQDIERLNEAQHVLRKILQQEYENLTSGSRELVLDSRFVEELMPYVPGVSKRLSSQAYFSQVVHTNDEDLLVINRAYTGFTLMFSRFAHFFDEEEGDDIVAELRSSLAHLQPENSIFVELKGGYDATNLNLHPQVTDYEFVCPGEFSARPSEEQITLDDLFIQDDAEEGRLRLYSRRLGKEVIPLYLGFLLPIALPEIQQVLFNFSSITMCPLDLWKYVAHEDAECIFYPRLRYKHLVLQRAFWRFQPGSFPARTSGQSDANYFLTITRWRQKWSLPTRVFVTTERTKSPVSEIVGEKVQKAQKAMYKPMYVDFESYFSLTLLETVMRGSSLCLLLTEMLPERDQLWLHHEGQSYVSEFLWELNRVQSELYVS